MTVAEKSTVQVKGNVMYTKNTSGSVSVQEASAIADEIRRLVEQHNVTKMIVDNRELNGVWNSEVNDVWSDLMTWLVARVDKCATLCKSVVNKMQLDRLSRQAGTQDKVKAFTSEVDVCLYLGMEKIDF
ncbi:MAG TPA: hypothetical protein VFV52_07105 [Bacilli bacterium]|nr:hypothetical protein [Bacilli bacterium]